MTFIPTALDLFSGSGGLTLGLKQAGFQVLGAIEVDKLACDTYRENHPEVKLWERDIRDIEVSEIKKSLGLRRRQLDLLAGCPPCQGFSSLRTLNGSRLVQDDRNDLVLEFVRFAKELLPKAIMMENVPGLAEDERIKKVCAELRELGYHCDYRILNAVDYGVPQRRRRVILLAGRYGELSFAQAQPRKVTVRETIAHLPEAGRSGDPLHDLGENRSAKVLELIKRIPKDGGGRADLPDEMQLACHTKSGGFKDVYGRMAWDQPAPTITSGCFNPSKGRFLHPEEDRAITLREAALLQGFPPDYHFSLKRGKTGAALLIGNALPPGFVRHHAEQVRTYLRRRRKKRHNGR